MPPLHLAVREGHLPIVRLLASRGAVNPKYRTYPYNEDLVTVATDRGYDDIAAILQEHGRSADPDRPDDEGGHIEYATDFERQRFQRLVAANDLEEVERMLEQRPELATDPLAFDAEGILSGPANRRHRAMIDLLMKHGARVPPMTKWGAEYYFKHDSLAAMFLERGMDARHRNCHRTTLLHEMSRRGETVRARLLLDYGAGIDAIDDEFKSTPLGFAARWGQRKMVRLLLDRGADRRLAGAAWAEPAAWARRKGHRAIADDLG
jgi:ankyrin repeat protein